MKQTDKQIATTVLKLMREHELSWDEEAKKFTRGDLWKDHLIPYLSQAFSYSGFALSLSLLHTDEAEHVCKVVIEMPE